MPFLCGRTKTTQFPESGDAHTPSAQATSLGGFVRAMSGGEGYSVAWYGNVSSVRHTGGARLAEAPNIDVHCMRHIVCSQDNHCIVRSGKRLPYTTERTLAVGNSQRD